MDKIVKEVKALSPDAILDGPDEALTEDGNWENADGSCWYILSAEEM